LFTQQTSRKNTARTRPAVLSLYQSGLPEHQIADCAQTCRKQNTACEAKDYVDKTKVDALAIAVGNAHGAYKLPPKLDFDRIKTIANTIDVPLVLHGGSGLTDDDFRRAISQGISKVNIFTDLNLAAANAEKELLMAHDNKGVTDLIPLIVDSVRDETMKKMMLFSSNDRV